jgi:hypothetical protein
MSSIQLSSSLGLVDVKAQLGLLKAPDEAWRRVRNVRWPMFNGVDERELEIGLDEVAGRCTVQTGTEVLLPDGRPFGKFDGATFRRY